MELALYGFFVVSRQETTFGYAIFVRPCKFWRGPLGVVR